MEAEFFCPYDLENWHKKIPKTSWAQVTYTTRNDSDSLTVLK